MNDITIRFATPEDAADILAIYSYYVEKTASIRKISFSTHTKKSPVIRLNRLITGDFLISGINILRWI